MSDRTEQGAVLEEIKTGRTDESLSTSSASTQPSTNTQGSQSRQDLHALTALLQLERQARSAQSVKELQFLAVNETRRLIPFRQAFLFVAGASETKTCHVEAASSLPAIERNAPYIQWVERTLHTLRTKAPPFTPQQFTEADCPVNLRAQWKEFTLPHVLWCPFLLPDSTFIGGMWMTKEKPWQDGEITIAQRLAETLAHAWGALAGNTTITRKTKFSKKWLWLAVIGVPLIMTLPVSLSTLAPAEIVAQNPAMVTAPLDGILADILVPPNTRVEKWQPLFVYEDTTFRSEYEVAEKNLSRAFAEYRKAVQGGFTEDDTTAQIPLLKAEVKLRETERDYAHERLGFVEVLAPRSGLLLYTDRADWIGRPVEVGQRIMEIANPQQMELQIDLPIDDAIVLRNGAAVEVFLDARPLDSIKATVTHASYHAQVLPGNILAYRVTATLEMPPNEVRIGWRGTAKIYGEKTTMFFLLFRRPISTARQFLGW